MYNKCISTCKILPYCHVASAYTLFLLPGLEMFKQKLEVGSGRRPTGCPGQVRSVKKQDVKRGMILCLPGSVLSHTQLKAQVGVYKCVCY